MLFHQSGALSKDSKGLLVQSLATSSDFGSILNFLFLSLCCSAPCFVSTLDSYFQPPPCVIPLGCTFFWKKKVEIPLNASQDNKTPLPEVVTSYIDTHNLHILLCTCKITTFCKAAKENICHLKQPQIIYVIHFLDVINETILTVRSLKNVFILKYSSKSVAANPSPPATLNTGTFQLEFTVVFVFRFHILLRLVRRSKNPT